MSFCAWAQSLAGERPEAYVGSADHLRDVEQLLLLAPGDIRGAVETYRDFLAAGGVDPADPDTNLTEAWHDAVQAAVAAIQDYIVTHC